MSHVHPKQKNTFKPWSCIHAADKLTFTVSCSNKCYRLIKGEHLASNVLYSTSHKAFTEHTHVYAMMAWTFIIAKVQMYECYANKKKSTAEDTVDFYQISVEPLSLISQKILIFFLKHAARFLLTDLLQYAIVLL